eukprot:CAMPEP_0182430306 /NCGR_PEP_ID=MMETSP1167-20130531/39283_1 /TAXON_ID=2988 /ORGANISM="Mallomonas Sp, Strain CCMP3275" /LENGTH=158 /DNA_ID=CAMNT_0024615247 /DNA_START=203 /DNA_END=679 /DNA_ORIENTATION=-
MLSKREGKIPKRQKPIITTKNREPVHTNDDVISIEDQVKVGCIIERTIEGCWFIAEVMSINEDSLTIRYLDDGNVEDMVPFDEIRLTNVDKKTCTQKRDTLPKPLQGLVEDDSEIRHNHQPTVVVHHDMDTERAIIINGEERQLAAGGGLRALRYLRK